MSVDAVGRAAKFRVNAMNKFTGNVILNHFSYCLQLETRLYINWSQD